MRKDKDKTRPGRLDLEKLTLWNYSGGMFYRSDALPATQPTALKH